MILSRKPLTLAEVESAVPKSEETKVVTDYLKKFTILSKEKAEKLIEELRALNNLKLREESFVKLADFLPKDVESLNKVLWGISLSEEEANAIIAITSKY